MTSEIYQNLMCVCVCVCENFNPLKAELHPICHLLALLGGANIVAVSRLRIKETLILPLGLIQYALVITSEISQNLMCVCVCVCVCENFNPLNAELNPICHLLALLGGATIVVVIKAFIAIS